ncbi:MULTISPECIES: hypothetical protein [unclassified Streptomyces]|uniref:hypothetical protein n=1 Tax=unclassified Streptomyces TaxID=2593676 RepID=UPI0004CBB941|nr:MULTISPECIES: hypothetical protein [unclassified Streptomyces]KOV77200.1 membrane protein [Streptomyces sp. NRRL WC-3723]
MNTTPAVTAGAVTFVWLGMVLAISFLEAPLKFRAPGVTIPVGLGIGRLVFRALNAVEAVLAVVVVLAVALGDAPAAVIALTAAVAALLLAQLAVVRPLLNRRSDRVLAGEELPRSRSHLWYVALEVLKAGTLVALGVALLTA